MGILDLSMRVVVKEGGSGGILTIVSSVGDSIDDVGLLDGVRVPIWTTMLEKEASGIIYRI